MKAFHPALRHLYQQNLSPKNVILLKEDLDFLLSRTEFSSFSNFIQQHQFTLDYSESNCRNDQVSCYYPSHSDVIFLNKNFFELPRVERIGTILHELHHLSYQIPHISCPTSQPGFSECDANLSGAYGIEILFYKKAQESPGNIDATNAYQKNIGRIVKKSFE